MEWLHTQEKVKQAKSPEKALNALLQYDATWIEKNLLCCRSRPPWKNQIGLKIAMLDPTLSDGRI